MFTFGLVLLASLMISAAAAAVGAIGWPVVMAVWLCGAIVMLALMMSRDRERSNWRWGLSILALVAVAAGLVLHGPLAHAEVAAAIAPPPGEGGLWGLANGYLADGLGVVVTAVVAWACAAFAARTKIKIRTDQEAQIRETMLTGAFEAAHRLELMIADRWTPAQQQKVVDGMVSWAGDRATAELKALGLPGFVVDAMAHKVLGQLQTLTRVVDTAAAGGRGGA